MSEVINDDGVCSTPGLLKIKYARNYLRFVLQRIFKKGFEEFVKKWTKKISEHAIGGNGQNIFLPHSSTYLSYTQN